MCFIMIITNSHYNNINANIYFPMSNTYLFLVHGSTFINNVLQFEFNI